MIHEILMELDHDGLVPTGFAVPGAFTLNPFSKVCQLTPNSLRHIVSLSFDPERVRRSGLPAFRVHPPAGHPGLGDATLPWAIVTANAVPGVSAVPLIDRSHVPRGAVLSVERRMARAVDLTSTSLSEHCCSARLRAGCCQA